MGRFLVVFKYKSGPRPLFKDIVAHYKVTPKESARQLNNIPLRSLVLGTKMGVFRRDKGSKAQIIKLHHRRLRHTPIPNEIRFAHWALQVGDHFYEIAAPPKDFVALKLHDDVIRQLKRQSEGNGDDSGDDDAIDPSLETESDFHFSDEDDYKPNTTIVHIVEGILPLQISKGNDWRRLNRIKSHTMGSTYLKSEKVIERAVHIFKAAFQKRYDFLYYNCHAFVCYLHFSISLLDKSAGPCLVVRQPPHEERNLVASVVIYTVWRALMTSTAPKSPFPGPTPTKTWSMPEKRIVYSKIIPPQAMHNYFVPSEVPPVSQRRQIRSAVKHVEHKSHAAHVNNQLHHDIMQNVQNQIITASISQQAAAQAVSSQAGGGSASWNNPGSNPSAFGLTPGMGFGF